MDTVYDFPFELSFNGLKAKAFSEEELEIYSKDFPPFSLFENDEVEIYFNSSDANARLYLDALDVLPDGYGVLIDDNGRAYRQVSTEPFPLYKNNDEFDALRVDQFRVEIVCEEKHYFGLLDILPKQLNSVEWRMMKDDLEEEITGLAQDIVRRNIGLGDRREGAIPPQKVYNFFVIRKYASKILSALIDLQKTPKYQIVTEYTNQESFKAAEIDSTTVQRYLRHGGSDSYLSVPTKHINYDIQENRLLKHIIKIYDNELVEFIYKIKGIQEYRKNLRGWEHKQYIELYEEGINEFLETAYRLQKITNVIKNQEWYKTVSSLNSGMIPHSFVLDSRYGIIYKMYQELQHARFKIQLDPTYSYSWKKSSMLYEMWCYIRLCRELEKKYKIEKDFWNLSFGEDLLFPYLRSGTKMIFSDERIRLDVIYDQTVPKTERNTSLYENPFFTMGSHNRPDIVINIYNKENDWYIGSVILECKYRKLSSFWQSLSTSSAKAQIVSYYSDNKSNFTFGGWGRLLDSRPIENVIVLTPDFLGDNRYFERTNTLIKALRPEKDGNLMNELLNSITLCIDNRLKVCQELIKKT